MSFIFAVQLTWGEISMTQWNWSQLMLVHESYFLPTSSHFHLPCNPVDDSNAWLIWVGRRGWRCGPALMSTLAQMYRWAWTKNEKLQRKQPRVLEERKRYMYIIHVCITNTIGEIHIPQTVFLSMCILSKCRVSINNHYLASVATDESGLANHLPSGR